MTTGLLLSGPPRLGLGQLAINSNTNKELRNFANAAKVNKMKHERRAAKMEGK